MKKSDQLDNAQSKLGWLFEIAKVVGLGTQDLLNKLVASHYVDELETWSSGIMFAKRVLEDFYGVHIVDISGASLKGSWYWTGCAIAMFKMETGREWNSLPVYRVHDLFETGRLESDDTIIKMLEDLYNETRNN